MTGRYRFYCVDCKRFMDRRQVVMERDNDYRKIYYCAKCDAAVIQVNKVRRAWDVECIEYIISKNAVEDFL